MHAIVPSVMSEEHMLETFPSSGRAEADIEEPEDFAPPHHRPPNVLLYAIFVGKMDLDTGSIHLPQQYPLTNAQGASLPVRTRR